MNAITPNRRHYERVSTERPVTLLAPDNTSFQGKMIDLSMQGAGIIIHNNCVPCKELDIVFNLPTSGNTPITVASIITHSSPVRGECLLGVEFIDILKQYETAIYEFIRFHHRLD